MPQRYHPAKNSSATFLALVIAATGCTPPRGPINIDPLLPRWALAHGDDECEPSHLPKQHVPLADPSAIRPPVPKFHPLPTRPVFSPASEFPTPLPSQLPTMPAKEPLTARRMAR